MSQEVFITRLTKFLPNQPVSNEEMESRLGLVNQKTSKAKSIVLRNNGIKTRYYALDNSGNITHSNVDLTKAAIDQLYGNGFEAKDIELLTCGTTSPDQLLPSHASMVHGKLGVKPIELLSFMGSCCSGIHGLKHAWLSILSGQTTNAVSTSSERLSPWMLSRNFNEESQKLEELNQNPYIAFEKEFLRWMLSDGAAAALLQNKPSGEISLKIEWIECISYANELETCMYIGGEKQSNGDIKGWADFSPKEWLDNSTFSMRQDTKILAETIVPVGGRFLKDIIEKRNFDVSAIDHFLPHLSSMFFKKKIQDELISIGLDIPESKWFTNLTWVGNVGSASIFLMLEELFNSGKLKKGEKILLMVPESARFNYAYVLLTVV